MTPAEAYNLLTDVQHDYVCMLRELHRVKKSVVAEVDPWTLPIVQRMLKGRRDLSIASGIKGPPGDPMYTRIILP